MIDAKAAGELADELEAKIAAMEKHATASDPLPQWSIAKDLLTHFMYVHRFDILAALRDDVARCEREEVEAWREWYTNATIEDSIYSDNIRLNAAKDATDAARAKAGEGT